jgi:hypothetical protein
MDAADSNMTKQATTDVAGPQPAGGGTPPQPAGRSSRKLRKQAVETSPKAAGAVSEGRPTSEVRQSNEATDEDALDDLPRSNLFALLTSGMISMALHAVSIVVLALITLPVHIPLAATYFDGVADGADEAGLVEPTTFEAVDLKTTQLVSTSISAADLSSAIVGDPTQVTASAIAVGNVEAAAHAEVGDLFAGDGGRQMESSIGSGVGQAAQFFGVKAAGRRFIFVVDSSNSMRGGKFAAAKEELMYAVRRLSKDQAFYIIFFDQNAERMILAPEKEPPLLPVLATSTNINRVEKWIATVENQVRTDPFESVRLAIEMVPDAIYILTDGKFTDKGRTENWLKANNVVDDPVDGKRPKVVIHTICFWQNDGEEAMKKLAKDYGGTYRFVPREGK